MCFSNPAYKSFSNTANSAYGNMNAYSNSYMTFANTFQNMLNQRFGEQTAVNQMIQNKLGKTILPRNVQQYQYDPKNGGYQGSNNVAGAGGAGGSGMGRDGEGRGEGRGESQFPNNADRYGYNSEFYDIDFDPQRFHGAEEAALRAQATEEVTNAFGDSSMAFGVRANQLGGFSPGLLAAGQSNLSAERAAAEAQAQRDVIMQGSQNLRNDLALKAQLDAQLGIAEGGAYGNAAALALQEAMQKRAIGASNSQASAARAQQSHMFAEQMKLAAAQNSQDFFMRGIGALQGLSGNLMNPTAYGQMGLGALGGGSGMWGNAYNTASQGMVATRPTGGWGSILGGLAGGALSAFTGGIGTGLFGLGAGMFGGGGGNGGVPNMAPSYYMGYGG